MSKYFRVEAALAPGARVPLEAHRFLTVLRLTVGDPIVLCDPSGALFNARIARIGPPGGPEAEVLGPAESPDRNPQRPLEVWVPLLKGGRTDDLVRQLTELGATRIVPFFSRHAVVRLDARKAADKRERFAAIALEACHQCGRTDLPEVLLPVGGMPGVGPGV